MGKPTLVDSKEITVIDYSKIANATVPLETNKDILLICESLKDALTHSRVVFLINHGITEPEAHNMYRKMNTFLALPWEVRKKHITKGMEDFHGYLPNNTEALANLNQSEIREGFNFIGSNRNLPDNEIPGFTQSVNEMTKKFIDISRSLLQIFSICLDVHPNFLEKHHKYLCNHTGNTSGLRILYYPPVHDISIPNMTRCGQHTDYGTFTLLLQSSEGGLEVFCETGEWRRVGYLHGGMFLNAADMLEIWSSGKYKAIQHRVVIPEEEYLRKQDRYSMGYFLQPDSSTVVKPLHPGPGEHVEECVAGDKIAHKILKSYGVK